MKTKNRFPTLFAVMLILALVAAGCQPAKKAEGPPDGEYSKGGNLLTLEQGHFEIRDYEKGSYTVDGDKITFTAETMTEGDKFYCGDSSVYTLQWSFDEEASLLTFKPGDDPCPPRRDNYTLGHWAYSKVSQ